MYCKRRLKTFHCCKMGEFYTMCNVLWSHSVYLSRISVTHSFTVLQYHTLHSCLLQNVTRANKPSFCIHGDHCNKLRKNCFTSAGIYFMGKSYKTSTSDIENCTNFLPESGAVINTLKLIYIWNGHRNQINIIGNIGILQILEYVPLLESHPLQISFPSNWIEFSSEGPKDKIRQIWLKFDSFNSCWWGRWSGYECSLVNRPDANELRLICPRAHGARGLQQERNQWSGSSAMNDPQQRACSAQCVHHTW